MISSNDKNVKLKGSEMQIAEDFASLVFVLQDVFGRERLMNLFAASIAVSDFAERKNYENYKPKRNN